MSKEKQIEEMANCINAMDEPNAHYYGKHMKMHEAFADCFTIAKHLYNEGYRKQSEGEWIYKEKEDAFFCSLCDMEALIDANTIGIDFAIAELSDFCPHCGAKMKGGAE